jgi:hypothetical protein
MSKVVIVMIGAVVAAICGLCGHALWGFILEMHHMK